MAVETSRSRIVARLARAGRVETHGGKHGKFTHVDKPGVTIVVPRHRTLSPGVARGIALLAGW